MSATGKILSKLAGLAIAVGVAGGGFVWWQWQADESQRIIEDQRREIEYLRNVADRLTLERRVAKIVVTGQRRDEAGRLVTDLLFFDIDRNGNELPPKPFTVVGETVHIDAKVIKFDEGFVREGDPLRGQSIALWDRLYGSATPPEEGQDIDPAPEAPRVYRGEPSLTGFESERAEFESELWSEFWKLAREPEYARSKGVRVAHGEGVYGIFTPDNVYELTLQSNGGLSLYTAPMPGIYRELLKAVKPETPSPAEGQQVDQR